MNANQNKDTQGQDKSVTQEPILFWPYYQGTYEDFQKEINERSRRYIREHRLKFILNEIELYVIILPVILFLPFLLISHTLGIVLRRIGINVNF